MKTLNIKELNIEVEIELHTDMNRINLIKIPKGWRVLTLSEWLFIYNNYKDKINYGGNPDEVVEQPIKESKDKYPYWNVWFGLLGIGSELSGSNRVLGDWVRGVRFCRKLK